MVLNDCIDASSHEREPGFGSTAAGLVILTCFESNLLYSIHSKPIHFNFKFL